MRERRASGTRAARERRARRSRRAALERRRWIGTMTNAERLQAMDSVAAPPRHPFKDLLKGFARSHGHACVARAKDEARRGSGRAGGGGGGDGGGGRSEQKEGTEAGRHNGMRFKRASGDRVDFLRSSAHLPIFLTHMGTRLSALVSHGRTHKVVVLALLQCSCPSPCSVVLNCMGIGGVVTSGGQIRRSTLAINSDSNVSRPAQVCRNTRCVRLDARHACNSCCRRVGRRSEPPVVHRTFSV